MILGILLSTLMGVLAGTISGLLPGIHINLVGTILIGLSASALSGVYPIYLVSFVAAMAIAHTFIDFIPSIFLGCPDTETQLSVLPGHELLKDGKGYEAVMLSAIGGIFAVFILIFISFPLSFFFSEVYYSIHSIMFWVLLATAFLLILTEKRKFTALFVFLAAGILGLCVLNVEVKEPLLPLLTGLFGSSMLITSIKNKIQIPRQEIAFPKQKVFKPLFGAIIASPLCGFLPGLGSGQAAILGNSISRTDKKGFLILIGATNILVMGLSFVSLYSISKTRTGAAVAIQQIIGKVSWQILVVVLLVVLMSGIISFFLVKFLAKFLSQRINKVNYFLLSIFTLIFLVGIVMFFSGFLGILILIASTLFGIYCNSLSVKKSNMMGCLLIPTILFYLLKII